MERQRVPGDWERAGRRCAPDHLRLAPRTRVAAPRVTALAVAGLLCTGCPESLSSLIQQCQAEKAAGTRTDSPGDCGCNPPAGVVCTEGSVCFHGGCCDPATPGSVCYGTTVGTDGGSECDGGDGGCACNAAANQTNNENCGCRGPCNGATCVAGACQCTSAEETYCYPATDGGDGTCVPLDECPTQCVATQHETDVANCWCAGPCPTGDICSADAGNVGQQACLCDPLAHQSDNLDCGCHGRCATGDGKTCEGGVCVCESANCPQYQSCTTGSCACDSTLCPAGQSCSGSTCACDPAKHTTKASCGCPPTACGTGKTCKADGADGGRSCQ